jgi:TrpR-related protein YerC/YecD
MSKWRNEDTDELFKTILALESIEECYEFFEDACTIKEILDIAQRLKIAKMLKAGVNYATISKETGVSTATISRVSKCIEYGMGGYNKAIEKAEKRKAK